MSHRFYEGEIYHKRFRPKLHIFTYDYFFIDIDVYSLDTLQIPLFALEGKNLMSFNAQDHFGANDNFLQNCTDLITSLGWEMPASLRFLTLPRMFNFVFNPISILLLIDKESKPTHIVAQVHNYNGGRVLYPMALTTKNGSLYTADHPKSMYVSPFLGYEGNYHFALRYTDEKLHLTVNLEQKNQPILTAVFNGEGKEFSTSALRSILCNHTFLTLFVVSRTLWQTFLLKLKGLSWSSPRPSDQYKKELS